MKNFFNKHYTKIDLIALFLVFASTFIFDNYPQLKVEVLCFVVMCFLMVIVNNLMSSFYLQEQKEQQELENL